MVAVDLKTRSMQPNYFDYPSYCRRSLDACCEALREKEVREMSEEMAKIGLLGEGHVLCRNDFKALFGEACWISAGRWGRKVLRSANQAAKES